MVDINIVLISAEQKNDSFTHIHTYMFTFRFLFYYGLT